MTMHFVAAGRRPSPIALLALCVLLGATPVTPARGAALVSGDMVVASQTGGKVYVVKPSGGVSLVSSGGLLNNPSHVIIDNQGIIFTAERTGGTSPAIVRIDPATGGQTLVTSGQSLDVPVALAFDQSNNLVVGNRNEQLFRVNPQTGAQTAITVLGGVRSIQDVEVDPQGRMVVVDAGIFNGGLGKIVRFDPATGLQTTISQGDQLFNPSDLLIRPSGDYVVTNRLANGTSQILQIDPVSGAQHLALTVPSEGWITLQDQNTIVYADFFDNLSILRANLLTGQTQTITSFHFPQNLVGIATYTPVPVPEPSTVSMTAIGFALLVFSNRRRIRTSMFARQ